MRRYACAERNRLTELDEIFLDGRYSRIISWANFGERARGGVECIIAIPHRLSSSSLQHYGASV